MLDIVAAIFATAYCAAQAGLLIGPADLRVGSKIALFAATAAWLAVVVAVYGLRVLSPGTLGPIPVNLVPFTLLLAILFGAWVLIPRARDVLLSVPMPALVAVHAGRIAGVFFLLLYFDGRLSAPFAPVAAIGDIVTGAIALLLLALFARGLNSEAMARRLERVRSARPAHRAYACDVVGSGHGIPRVHGRAGHAGHGDSALDLRARDARSGRSPGSHCDHGQAQSAPRHAAGKTAMAG
jgi:hypothetical protein